MRCMLREDRDTSSFAPVWSRAILLGVRNQTESRSGQMPLVQRAYRSYAANLLELRPVALRVTCTLHDIVIAFQVRGAARPLGLAARGRLSSPPCDTSQSRCIIVGSRRVGVFLSYSFRLDPITPDGVLEALLFF